MTLEFYNEDGNRNTIVTPQRFHLVGDDGDSVEKTIVIKNNSKILSYRDILFRVAPMGFITYKLSSDGAKYDYTAKINEIKPEEEAKLYVLNSVPENTSESKISGIVINYSATRYVV